MILCLNPFRRIQCEPTKSKIFNWRVHKDQKGTKKPHTQFKAQNQSFLRSSPSRSRSLSVNNSASPERADMQTETETDILAGLQEEEVSPNSPNRLVSGGHTSRSDTPTRTRQRVRYRCRNAGCTVNETYGSTNARNRHERFNCTRGNHSQVRIVECGEANLNYLTF